MGRLNVGGTSRYLAVLLQGLNASCVEARLATGHVLSPEVEACDVDPSWIIRIPHMARPLSLWNDILALGELWQTVRRFKPDIVHTHTFKGGLLGRLLPIRTQIVHSYHGNLLQDPDFNGLRGRVLLAIERGLAYRCAAIVTNGKAIATELLDAGIGSEHQYHAILPGVNRLPSVDKQEARRSLALEQDDVVVAWVGRLVAVKRPQMVADIARSLPELVFVVAGGGELEHQMRALAPPNLRLLGWCDPAILYAAADIALSTSASEAVPYAVVEAQLAGLPVVAPPVGSMTEAIADGLTGVIAQDSQLISALELLARDGPLRARMANEAAGWAAEQFSVDRMVRFHTALYSRLLGPA